MTYYVALSSRLIVDNNSEVAVARCSQLHMTIESKCSRQYPNGAARPGAANSAIPAVAHVHHMVKQYNISTL